MLLALGFNESSFDSETNGRNFLQNLRVFAFGRKAHLRFKLKLRDPRRHARDDIESSNPSQNHIKDGGA